MEVTSGIHHIKSIKGVNCYLCIVGDTMIVVDTGMPGNANKIIDYVVSIGKDPHDIQYIFLTHADIDHIGSAADLKDLTGAEIAIHPAEAPVLSGKEDFRAVRGPLGWLFRLLLPFMRFRSIEPDVLLKDGCKIGSLEVITTPGHSEGSVCLYLPHKAIFVGDALRSDADGNPKPASRKLSSNTAQAAASLVMISKLDFDVMLPGHGAPVTENASGKVREMVMDILNRGRSR